MATRRTWANEAIRRIEADVQRSADTHLIRMELTALPGLFLYFKDESVHPTGSLKHRLARSLFLYGICNGSITEGTTVIEASSGSTAVSEAYFARLLDLAFVAVMPRGTSPEKIAWIEHYGGTCHLVDDAAAVEDASRTLARDTGGHFLDQFENAERVTDWRGNNNIAESIFDQMRREEHPIPRWIVCSAGTGGTSATIGRYVRYRRHDTEVCVVDPEDSVFHRYYADGDVTRRARRVSVIEGIGRPRVVPSFQPAVIDRMIAVPDAASVAAVRVLSRRLGRRCGGSTGTNFFGACQLLAEMRTRGEEGSVVTLLCDGGERYAHTLFDDGWVAERGLDLAPHLDRLEGFLATGTW